MFHAATTGTVSLFPLPARSAFYPKAGELHELWAFLLSGAKAASWRAIPVGLLPLALERRDLRMSAGREHDVEVARPQPCFDMPREPVDDDRGPGAALWIEVFPHAACHGTCARNADTTQASRDRRRRRTNRDCADTGGPRAETRPQEADEIRATVVKELNQAFVTPIDREDIYALTSALDDILEWARREDASIHSVVPQKASLEDLFLAQIPGERT